MSEPAAAAAFVAFAEAVGLMAPGTAPPQPAHAAAAAKLANAIRAGKLTTVYQTRDGQFVQLAGAALADAAIDIANGLYVPPDDPNAPRLPTVARVVGLCFDGDDEPPPRLAPEPRPDIKEPKWPKDDLHATAAPARRAEIQAGYYTGLKAYQQEIAAWEAREAARIAADEAWKERWHERQKARERQNMWRQAQVKPQPPASEAPRGLALYVAADDLDRLINLPGAAPPMAIVQTASGAGRPNHRPPSPEKAMARQLAFRRVRERGLPKNPTILVVELHNYFCRKIANDPPSERSIQRWVAEFWQELEELAKPFEL